MRYYRYKVQDRSGKLSRGIKKAARAEIVMEELKQDGLKVLNVRVVGFSELLYYKIATLIYEIKFEGRFRSPEEGKPKVRSRFLAKVLQWLPPPRVGKAAVANFTRELHAMLSAGMQLEKSLAVIADSEAENPYLKQVLDEITNDIRKGARFSVTLAKYPKVFPAEYSGLIKVGEETGKITDVLNTLAQDLDREYRLQKRVRSALVYPAFVFSVAIVSVFGIFIYVFPEIAQILKEMKLELPLSTKVLLFSVEALTNPFILLVILLIIAVTIFLIKNYFKTIIGQYYLSAMKFRLPVIGVLNNWLFAERFCRIMAMFFKYSVPVHISLEMVSSIFRNSYLEEHLFARLYLSVVEGEDLHIVLRENPILPRMVSNLAAVGEETGEMASCLYKAADIFELEIDQMIQKLIAMIDPIIVATLGLFVFFVVLSIFLPLYQAITSLGQ